IIIHLISFLYQNGTLVKVPQKTNLCALPTSEILIAGQLYKVINAIFHYGSCIENDHFINMYREDLCTSDNRWWRGSRVSRVQNRNWSDGSCTLRSTFITSRINVLPLRLPSDKKEKHVNMLYLQDPHNDGLGLFAWIKNLSRLVSSQLSKKEHKKFFCDRTSEKLELHAMDCRKINDCAIRLPSEDDKWLEFDNHCNKESIPFVVSNRRTKDKNTNHFRKNCVKLRFIDSFKFLSASLDKLASYLDKDKLKIVRSEFSILSDEKLELLTRKGVFPYEYVDYVEKLQDTRLPPRESFYSSLTGDTVSESDYAHAVNVWQRFSIRTLGEYSDLYLKTDVLLLADIFENFRESCVASYGLDPAHYYTLPGYVGCHAETYAQMI
ncbi:hypothetical protein ALC57_18082, partial [Trachymyrmex cornetzi]